MTIKVTYNVTDVYMSQSVSPVYINVSYSDGGASGGGVWGSITGTLSNQTDLQTALDLKVPYSGATGNVNIGEYELKAGQLTLDTSPTGTAAVGTIRWNDTTGTSETTLKGGNVIIKNGVDLVARVVNKVSPNTTLTKAAYQAVRVSGAQGQRLAIELAQANNDAGSADTIGLVTETIAPNQEGFIMTVGQLEGINTTGSLQGETWVDGDVLYLSPTTAGAITNVKPTGATGHLVIIGYVEYAHANNGKLYIKVMNGFELAELHDTSIVSPSNNQGLFYNSSNSLWENKTISTALGYTPVPTTRNITINGVTYDLSADRTYTISTGISGSGASGQVTYWTGASAVSGSNNLFWDNANGRLGIGTNVPAYTFDIPANNTNNIQYRVGTFQIQSYGLNNGFLSDNMYFNGTSWTRTTTGFGYGFQFYNGQLMLHGASTSSGIFTQNVKFKFDYEGAFVIGNNLNVTQGNYTGATALFTKTGNLILNSPTLDGGQRLQVYGDTLLRGSGNTSATTALTVQNSSSTNLFVVRNDGNVGIGTNAPAYNVDLNVNQNASTALRIFNNTSGASAEAAIFVQSNSTSGLMAFTKYSTAHNPYKIVSANDGLLYNGTAGDISILNDWASGRIKFSAGAVSTSQMTLFANGNLAINSGVTDLGVRFGVVGDTLLRGSGATSATTALTVQNSSSTNLFTVRNDGNTNISNGLQVQGPLNGTLSGAGFELEYNSGISYVTSYSRIGSAWLPMILRSSNLTITTAGTNNAQFFSSSGNLVLQNGGTFTDVASSRLTINSTTQGFLPPRMTTTQKNAITSPANGLVVFDTTLNKLCVYTTAWETITSI